MNLRLLLLLHAVPTLAAGVVLIAAPAAIPATVGIALPPGAYLLSYFLGAAELAIGFLSLGARALTDARSLRLICFSFIVFHLATAGVEVYAYMQGVSWKVWPNVGLRVLVSGLFYVYGVRRLPKV